MTEIDRLARLLAKCPSLAKAFAGEQTTFDGVAEPTDDDLHFITRVEGAPVKIQGRLGPDGVWRISAYHIAIPPEHEEAAEVAIAKLAGQEFLVLVDGVGETMVRDAIPRLLGKITHAEERESFMRQLAASRFAVSIH
jgi:hypothetical protein